MVGVAELVQTAVRRVGGPPVVDRPAFERREDADIVHGRLSALGVALVVGESFVRRGVHPVQNAGDPYAGLVEMGDRPGDRVEDLRALPHRRLQDAFGRGGAEKVGHQLRGALPREQLVVGQVGEDALDPGAVLNGLRNALGKAPSVDGAASRTRLLLGDVLRDI